MYVIMFLKKSYANKQLLIFSINYLPEVYKSEIYLYE